MSRSRHDLFTGMCMGSINDGNGKGWDIGEALVDEDIRRYSISDGPGTICSFHFKSVGILFVRSLICGDLEPVSIFSDVQYYE